jgi:hypothetical protein
MIYKVQYRLFRALFHGGGAEPFCCLGDLDQCQVPIILFRHLQMHTRIILDTIK